MNLARKTLACLACLALATGLMPGIAFADATYPDVHEHVYVGPETQTTVDVGNVTVSTDDPGAKYAVFAHSKNEDGATANVHGSASLTRASDSKGLDGVQAHANSYKATVNVDGDVMLEATIACEGEVGYNGVSANAMDVNSEAVVNVGRDLTAKTINTSTNTGNANLCGVLQNAYVDSQSQKTSSQVNVTGNVLVEAVDGSGELDDTAIGVAAFTHDYCSISTTIKGGVTVKGGSAYGISAATGPTDSGTGNDVVISIGQGGVTVEGIDSEGIQTNAQTGSITVRISGDVSATITNGGKLAKSIGVSVTGNSGKNDILVDGTITAKTAGVADQTHGGQLEVTAWKIDSDIVGAKWSNETRGLVEDGATEAAINYIIKLEQPKEGNILKLVGTVVKQATMVEGDKNFDVANMGQKVYLDVENGWTITAAFNGQGDKVALEKDSQGWFVIVPNGGGVYLSAQVAKVEPEPVPTPAPNPNYTVAGHLPATGDSGMPIVAFSLTAFASLALALFAASRMRSRRES